MTKMPPPMMLETRAVGANPSSPRAKSNPRRPTMIATTTSVSTASRKFLIEPRHSMAIPFQRCRYDSALQDFRPDAPGRTRWFPKLILTCNAPRKRVARTATAQKGFAALVF